ncbi:MAG TPA: DUF5602 domain-containing protein [Pyrinomonadaceae bacterium]
MNKSQDTERLIKSAQRRPYRKLLAGVALSLLVAGSAWAQSPAQRQSANNLLPATGESATAPVAGTYFGEARPLGNGIIRSWVKLDKDGKPTAIGLTFTEAALAGLPQAMREGMEETEVVLALPPEAGATAFNHIGVNWNPKGHEPAKVYDLAHFDFHFYMISPEARNRITAQGDDRAKARRQPPQEYIPAGYIYAPDSEVPRMGGHWANPQSNEFQGQPFTRTFLYGNYDGQIIFMEPMITKAFLETRASVTEILKQPARYARPGYYPTSYSVKYDPATKQYTVALEGLTLR